MFEDEEEIDGEIVQKKKDVRMVKMTGDIGTSLAPMMMIWQGVEQPKFSGRVEDWTTFENSWKRYLALLEESIGRSIPNSIKFEVLKSAIDDVNRVILQA